MKDIVLVEGDNPLNIEMAPLILAGEILEITWWDEWDEIWRPISDPMPARTVTHRFRIRNTGTRATFKVGLYIIDPFVGDYWNYSPSVSIEPGEGNIDWNIWTGMPATITVTFHLFADDTEVDSVTVTIIVV